MAAENILPGDMLQAKAIIHLWTKPASVPLRTKPASVPVAQLYQGDLCLVLTLDDSAFAGHQTTIFVLARGRLGWVWATEFLERV